LKKLIYISLTVLLFTNSTSVYFNEGKALEEAELFLTNKDFDNASIVLNKILKNDSNHVGALVNRGICNKELGKDDEARKDFEEALTFDKQNSVSNYELGMLLKDSKPDKALVYFEKALVLSKESLKNKVVLKRTFLEVINPFAVECEKIQKEIDLLKKS